MNAKEIFSTALIYFEHRGRLDAVVCQIRGNDEVRGWKCSREHQDFGPIHYHYLLVTMEESRAVAQEDFGVVCSQRPVRTWP